MSYLIIQDCVSWQVIGAGGAWLKGQDKALRFRTSEEAVEYCRKHRIDNYTLLLKFEDSQTNRSRSVPTLFTLLSFPSSDSLSIFNLFYQSFASVV